MEGADPRQGASSEATGEPAGRAPDLVLELREPEGKRPAPELPWATLLKVLGALFASAAWVQLIGGAILWIRLDQVDVTPTPAVALLPTELLFVVGLRSLVIPVVAGAPATSGVLMCASVLRGPDWPLD